MLEGTSRSRGKGAEARLYLNLLRLPVNFPDRDTLRTNVPSEPVSLPGEGEGGPLAISLSP